MLRLSSFIFLILVMITACRNIKLNQNRIYGVHVTSISPVILEDGSIINFNGFLNVFTYKDLILYESSYHFDSTVNEKLIFEEYRYQYFIYHKDSLFGTAYGIPYQPEPTRKSVDSILRTWGFKELTLEVVLQMHSPQSYFDEKSGIIHELYTGGTIKNDSISLYYNKNLKFPVFSFSATLDSVKKAKLYKIKVVNDSIQDPAYSFTLPKREFKYEMKDTVLKDDSKIRSLFNRYLEGK